MKPIFILFTRSFWLAIVTAALFLIEHQDLVPLLQPLFPFLDMEGVLALLPLATLIATIHQRSGASRPYSLNPKDL